MQPAANQLDDQDCYRALTARDARFDGRFFVGVTSTRVYCRPVCRVRVPLLKNCRFYRSAAEAESKGFRPCLKCRPELAPECLALDAPSALVQRCMRAMRGGALQSASLEQLAHGLGVSDRHLRRVFHDLSGVTPVQYLTTCRLLTAKQLLTDSQLSVLDVAYASGFRSLRRFNATFVEHYRIQPSALRLRARQPAQGEMPEPGLMVRLPMRTPFDAQHAFGFLEQRAIAGVELVVRSARRARYCRTVAHDGLQGSIEVRWQQGWRWLELRLSENLAPQLLLWLRTCRKVFDLDADPAAVQEVLGELAQARPGLRLIGAFDLFELAIRAVLGQQVTVKAARTIAHRLVQSFGEPVTLLDAPVSRLFPTAACLARAPMGAIAALGMPLARAQCVQDVAAAWCRDADWIASEPPCAEFALWLRAIRGIGPWTASYIAMRGRSEPDMVLPGDVVLRKLLQVRSDRELQARFEAFAPWRSYAVMHLWASAA